jgi:hypothetical protein
MSPKWMFNKITDDGIEFVVIRNGMTKITDNDIMLENNKTHHDQKTMALVKYSFDTQKLTLEKN